MSLCRPTSRPVSPAPVTTLKTPRGMPASTASSAIRSAVMLVSSAGLAITQLPAARAGPIFQASISMGKFHGRTQAVTPMGSRTTMARASSPAGATWSYILSASSACHSRQCSVSGRSTVSISATGLPLSRASMTTSSFRLRRISLHRRMMAFLRSAGCCFDHRPSSKASRALFTARSTSGSPQAVIRARVSPLAGLMVSKASPLLAVRALPSMKAPVGNTSSAAMAWYSSRVSSMIRIPAWLRFR